MSRTDTKEEGTLVISKAKLTQGPVGPLLIRLTIPMMWGLFAIMSFNLVDTMYIGRLGIQPLAAISFTFPVVMVLTNLAIGLGIGASSVVARAVGAHDHDRMQTLVTSSLFLSIMIVGCCATIGFFTVRPLFTALGAGPDLLPMIEEYMQIWYAGMLFLVVPMVGNYIIRATGDMHWPGVIMVVSSVVNLILDPLLIFGYAGFPKMGIQGAALATVLSWMISFSAVSSILCFREKIALWCLPPLNKIVQAWRSILHVALPAAGTHMIVPLGVGIIMRMVSVFGEEAVAAFGAASRIEMFAFIIILALSSVMGPFVGQNIGTHRYDRIREALRLCYRFSLYSGLGLAVLLALCSEPLMRLFTDNVQVIHYGKMYFYIVPLAYAAQGVVYIASGVFNGSGHPIPAAVISTIRMFVLNIPLAFLGQMIWGMNGIFAAYTVSCLLMGGIAARWSYGYILEKDGVVQSGR